jgi:hypothetical protein
MPTFQFAFFEFSDFSFTGGAGSTSQTVGLAGTFRLAPGSPAISVVVQDDEGTFQDGFEDPPGLSTGLNNQVLLQAATVNGVTYPAGTRIELEFAVSTSSVEGSQVFYYVRLGGVNVGITALSSEGLTPGVVYTITGSRDGSLAPAGAFPSDVLAQVPWNTLICFTHGTLVDTPSGPRLIETLQPGDLVTVVGNGSQPLRWVAERRVSRVELFRRPDLRPIRFEVGALGNTRPLLVSPQHRMLLTDWRAEVYFGEDSVLIAAKALENGTTIRQVVPDDGVIYCHLLFDRHEILITEGALSESFHPGEIGLGALDEAQRREIEALFPSLMLENRRAAFPIVRNADARVLRLPG